MPKVQRIDNVTVIELGREYDSLDTSTMSTIGEALTQIARDAEPPLVVYDLTQTRFVGSSFLDILVRAWKHLRERNGKMVLCGLSPLIAKVFEVARLDQILPQYETVDGAVDAIKE